MMVLISLIDANTGVRCKLFYNARLVSRNNDNQRIYWQIYYIGFPYVHAND